ncbi:hypothetical protein SSAG_01246 [Streptomyces sp. Mg1]|nr:hypothetical protein SSAG_01246 [Streptomyces sp. Mg1]
MVGGKGRAGGEEEGRRRSRDQEANCAGKDCPAAERRRRSVVLSWVGVLISMSQAMEIPKG